MTITGLPTNLGALAAEIHADNIRAGWWRQDAVTGRTLHRNTGELLALIHSEISEADEGYRLELMDDKLPHRSMVEVELADTAIRVLDMLGFYGDSCEAKRTLPLPFGPAVIGGGFASWISLMHRTTTAALEGFRKGDNAKGRAALVDLLGIIHFAGMAFEMDLTGAIAEKRAFNQVRADHKIENRAKVGGKSF